MRLLRHLHLPRFPSHIVRGQPYTVLRPSTALLARSNLKSFATVTSGTAQNLTEKIVQRYATGLPPNKYVQSGDYVSIKPHHCMTHDNSWPVATKFMSIGATKIHDREQIVMTLDHDVQNKSEANLKKYENIEKFARMQGVDFYPAGRGIGHQIMVEEGYAWPGTMTVASDSHSNMYGAVGCLGTPIVRTDAASIWATGQTWWQIPPVAKVELRGVLPKGVTGKDVIVALCGLFNNDEVLNHAIEFVGSEQTMGSIPVDDRLAIANMTTEWGALSGLFPIDNVLIQWLRSKATEFGIREPLVKRNSHSTHPRMNHERIDMFIHSPIRTLSADWGATYAKHLTLDLSTLSPHVAGPNSVKAATPVAQLEQQKIKIQKAYLVSCTNSRASDIAAAANVFRARSSSPAAPIPTDVPKVAEGVEFYIAPASTFEQAIAEKNGDWQTLLRAGAKPLPAGCGPCIGLGAGLLEAGEVGISATNRNFKGRMGSRDAFAYLASPEVVAASAIKGHISGPGNYIPPSELSDGSTSTDVVRNISIAVSPSSSSSSTTTKSAPASSSSLSPSSTSIPILPGFPPLLSGELLFCDSDNINTDGIYPGKYTYQDNITPDTMAQVCMENYDPSFREVAKPGDILVSGFNFGCGSSREQAATAILARDIRLVVAGSFGNIFSRNSVNNALLTVEVPRLIQRLREEFGGEKVATRRTGWWFTWDVRTSMVTVREGPEGAREWSQKVGELGTNVQEIIVRGGLEAQGEAKTPEQTQ
ncbi:hypothetical protein BDZ91DRAFT_714343 [Kalaharituber pfeilii]|nr:hypothetical protein BDZ91DRAFT_714343 [Kalaharituber pfeilii]